jgi:hypothetical protein
VRNCSLLTPLTLFQFIKVFTVDVPWQVVICLAR